MPQGAPRPLGRRQLSARWRWAAAVAGVVAVVQIASVRTPQHMVAALVGGGDGGQSLPASTYADALANAWKRIDDLSKQIDRNGGVLQGFGRRADAIVRHTLVAAGVPQGRDAEALQQALDGPLQSLFRRQLQVLRDQAADRYEEILSSRPNPYEAGTVAQQYFLDGVADLMRPGSGWSFEAEYRDLLAWLKRAHGRDTARVEAQGTEGQGKQVTIEVIRKLQQQSEAIQREAEVRGAFPWKINWQWFMDRSPVGFRGQYAQGRSIVELLLMPDPRAENNILNKIGPLNLAVGFDLFL